MSPPSPCNKSCSTAFRPRTENAATMATPAAAKPPAASTGARSDRDKARPVRASVTSAPVVDAAPASNADPGSWGDAATGAASVVYAAASHGSSVARINAQAPWVQSPSQHSVSLVRAPAWAMQFCGAASRRAVHYFAREARAAIQIGFADRIDRTAGRIADVVDAGAPATLLGRIARFFAWNARRPRDRRRSHFQAERGEPARGEQFERAPARPFIAKRTRQPVELSFVHVSPRVVTTGTTR